MSDPRRAAQCKCPGCDSQAELHVHLRLWFEGLGRRALPLDMVSSLKVCERHRRWAAQWLISPANKEAIAKGLGEHGFGEPDFSTAQIAFTEMEREKCVLELDARPGIPCDRAECVLPARYQVALNLWQIGQKKSAKPFQALTCLCVCNRHRGELKVEDVLSAEGKSKLLGGLTERGIPMPDFKMTELSFVPLTNGRRIDPGAFAKGAA